MKPSLKKLITGISITIFLILFIYFLLTHLQDFKSLTLVSPSIIFILILLFILSYIFIGIMNRSVLKALNFTITIKESFALSLITGFYNLISPFKGGMTIRAIYLKKHYNVSYTDFLLSLSAIGIFSFFITSAIGLITTAFLYKIYNIFSLPIFLIFLFTFLITFLIMKFSPHLKSTNFLLAKVKTLFQHWAIIKKKKSTLFSVLFFTLLALLNSALMLQLQFYSLGTSIPFLYVLFLTSLSSLSILINITPAGLGIQEAITVFSGLTLGISPVQSLAASLLGRAVSFLVLLILGLVASYLLLRLREN